MKLKFLSLFFALGIFALGMNVNAQDVGSPTESHPGSPTESSSGAPAPGSSIATTIAEAACTALGKGEGTETFCLSECRNGTAKEIGKCIADVMKDPNKDEKAKKSLTSVVGDACNMYCNSQTCKKVFGIGGDTNCKAICCAAKAGDKIINCCSAAKDQECCGKE